MIRDVDLLSYLPEFIQEYREIKEIMDAENPEFQFIENQTEIVKNNQFITTCNEDGIARFEKMLKITSNPEDTLQSRISRVLTRWNSSLPYTLRALKEKLTSICGEGNFEIVPDFGNYQMTLNVSLSLRGQLEELDNILSYMIPANILVTVNNSIIKRTISASVYSASTITTNRRKVVNTNE